jgi:hypothetical protein
MAYKSIPKDPSESTIIDYLTDLAGRKELLITKSANVAEDNKKFRGFNSNIEELIMPGMRLHGAQHFVRAFHNPNTETERILIEWQTGSGKSICVISVAHEFIKQFREIDKLGVEPPSVVIISFSVRETIQEDLLKYPEFGFVSKEDAERLKYLRSVAGSRHSKPADNRSYTALVGTLRRRVTDKSRGGYYKFYGYKEFANNLFKITQDGINVGFDIQQLYRQSAEKFDEFIEKAARQGYVVVNTDLINSLRNGLLICDEIHDVYNISETNNYGIAIQYVLDKLERHAPRAIFMSATPITGSAAEIVGLLNLLVPRYKLPGGKPLQRTDFFTRSKHIDVLSFTYNDVSYSMKKIKDNEETSKMVALKINKILITDQSESGGAPIVLMVNKEFVLIAGKDIIVQMIADKIDYAEIKVVIASEILETKSNENDDIEAAELVDLSSQFIISHLKDGAIERIAQLSAGRVSFLLDSDVSAYPKKWFVGEQIQDVPYLSITKCPMSEHHEKTVKREHSISSETKQANSGFNAIAYTLYDIAFPNPNTDEYGLYSSSDTLNKLESASLDWKTKVGININRKTDELTTISGEFLKLENIKKYSTKYYEIIKSVIEAINAGPGKIMIYHHRVRMSGVLLLQEALKYNGFVDESSNPTDNTICSVCGVKRSEHGKIGGAKKVVVVSDEESDEDEEIIQDDIQYNYEEVEEINRLEKHDFVPARFVVAHSDIDKSSMNRSIARFNEPSNLYGYQYRVLIGSKIIRQGLNFKAVRHQFVASLPTDYPTLMQVFGRVVRKDSHVDLQPKDRDVSIKVFISTYADNTISPELQRYIDKGKEFLVIQKVEKALHEYAVDGFINYDKIKEALNINGSYTNSLHGMVYRPKVLSSSSTVESTFLAYGYGDREVATIAAACRVLFKFRPVWTSADLWKALKAKLINKLYYNPDEFNEGNFALALESLRKPAGHPLTVIVKTGRYYVYSKVGADTKPIIDIESYIRESPLVAEATLTKRVSINVSDFIKKSRAGFEFNIKLREFERKYIIEKEAPIDLSLVECDGNFHYDLQRVLITSTKKATADDSVIIDLYKRYLICFTHDQLLNCTGKKNYRNPAKSLNLEKLIAYLTQDSIVVYNVHESSWYNMSLGDIGISRRTVENEVVVGYVSNQLSNSQIGKVEGRYKIRPPVQKMDAIQGDNRLIVKGAVCSSRPRDELLSYISILQGLLMRFKSMYANTTDNYDEDGEEANDEASDEANEEEANEEEANDEAGNDEAGDDINIESKYRYINDASKKRDIKSQSAGELCRTLCELLLRLEQMARNSKREQTRWMYLHCDKMPISGSTGGSNIDDPVHHPHIYSKAITALL